MNKHIDLMDYLDPVDGDADVFEITESMAHKLQDEIDELENSLDEIYYLEEEQ